MKEQKNNATLNGKSHYNAMRNCYLTKDGRYAYITWDGEHNRNVTHYLEVGKDGVTEELLIFLDEDDHDTDLQERYNNENADYSFQNKQFAYCRNQEDENATDPINELEDKQADIFDSLFPTEEKPSELLLKLISAMDKLTDAQRDLIYDHFGARKTLEEIRQAEITSTSKEVSQQAFSNRLKKIITRFCKEFDVPIPRKRGVKNEE
ncbi:MAG: hypothetical protein PHE51_02185 [Eubacteriales bacterium]|nr:hypothetical protein [Eubacteriales bacterium]